MKYSKRMEELQTIQKKENRTKQMVFRMGEEEFRIFAAEAKRRMMKKSELLRMLMQRFFFDNGK